MVPCSWALALFDARLVSVGAFSALPMAEAAPIKRIAITPRAGPMNGLANKLAENKNVPTITRNGSPKRLTNLPMSPPWMKADIIPTNAKTRPL